MKLAYLFPGQGPHSVSLVKNLYQEFAVVRETFEEASDALNFDFAKLCFDGSIVEIEDPVNLQPCITVINVATYRLFMELVGVVAEYCAGHSLGEYSALICADAIAFKDALHVVRYRGELTKRIVEQSLGQISVLTGVDSEAIEHYCKKLTLNGDPVFVSCYNSPMQVAVSGKAAAVEQVENYVSTRGGFTTPFLESGPFHSPLIQKHAELLRNKLLCLGTRDFAIPVISNVTAQPYQSPADIPELLTLQMLNGVRWAQTMHFLSHHHVGVMIEFGTRNTLSKLVKDNTPDMQAFHYGFKNGRKEFEAYWVARI